MRRHGAIVASFILGCGGGAVVPRGTPGTDGGAAAVGDGSGSGAAGSSSGASGGQGSTGAAGSRPGTIACAAASCKAATQVCCDQVFPAGPGEFACTPIGQCQQGGATLSCTSAADCAKSEVCCFSPSTATANLLAGGMATCQASCASGEAQLCLTNAECASGRTCQQTEAALPMACRDAPDRDASGTFSPASGSEGLGGDCTVNLSSPGDAGYQATCACPQGTCACFGPSSTRIVDFAGCPFCPGGFMSIGPTTEQHIFDLCGFTR
jgi:hypothetical protein